MTIPYDNSLFIQDGIFGNNISDTCGPVYITYIPITIIVKYISEIKD